jgi:hypothetical protein
MWYHWNMTEIRVCTESEERELLPLTPNAWIYRGRTIRCNDGTFFAQIGDDKWSQHPCVSDAMESIDETIAAYDDRVDAAVSQVLEESK